MSGLTPCNYCTLKRIKARARKERKHITMMVCDGGIGVWVHDGNEDPVAKKQSPQVWFMALTTHCCC